MTITFQQLIDDNTLLEQVKAAILARIAAMGPAEVYILTRECLTHIPELTPFNFEPTIKQALDSLMGEGMLERTTENGVTTYDLTDKYYNIDDCLNNYQEYKEPVEDLYRECG